MPRYIHIYTHLCWHYLGKGFIRHLGHFCWAFLLEEKIKKQGFGVQCFPGLFSIYISYFLIPLVWFGLAILFIDIFFFPGARNYVWIW